MHHAHCQECDGSWVLGMSRTVVLWNKGSVIQGISGVDESAEPKLDRRWEGTDIGQEVDEDKTESKVQLLRDSYTWYCTAYSK